MSAAGSTSVARALILTARPKTLAASVVPVLVGTSVAVSEGYPVAGWISLFAVLSAMMIQIGTNYVNDAIDFKKGADSETRLGEARASQQGWFTANGVLAMAAGFFALALAFGLPLVWEGGWPIVVIGLLSLAMGYGYTGGPFPLAYLGLGDLFVVIFFGLVAVGGVVFLQTHALPDSVWIAGLQVGLLATVLIAVNNLRDLDQDKLVNKKTLAVRLGPKLGRIEVLLLIAVAFMLNGYWLYHGFGYAFGLPFIALPLAIRVVWRLLCSQAGVEYNQILAQAAMLHMLFGVLLGIGLIIK